MATRCGRVDPGVIFHLHRQYGMGFEAIEATLYRDSGLKGISGISGDMRELLASAQPRAAQAVDVFVDRCVGGIGEMTAKAGGIDALVFSGGIGAHAPAIRARIGARLAFLGIDIDDAANDAGAERISSAPSRIPVYALQTDEQLVMARHALALTQVNASPPRSARLVMSIRRAP
jgi:acetate kinase